jgi:hypothetical protein
MQNVNSGPSFLIGMIAGVPSFAYAAINSETLTVMAGIAAGVIGLGWSIYRSSNDQRFDTILDRLDKAEKEASDYRDLLSKANKELVETRFSRDEVAGNYDLLKKRLAMHVCPTAADSEAKCGLPDIIKVSP